VLYVLIPCADTPEDGVVEPALHITGALGEELEVGYFGERVQVLPCCGLMLNSDTYVHSLHVQ